MANVLDRIRKLIALAASPNEHEARNASYLAAKLIREHDVQLSLANPALTALEELFSRPSRPPARPPKARRRARDFPADGTKTDRYKRTWSFYRFSPIDGNCTYCGGWLHRGDAAYVTPENDEELQHDRCWHLSNAPPKQPSQPVGITAEELDELFK